MNVLLDECAPKALKHFLSKHGHDCRTVQESSWAGKRNGELLSLAEKSFDVFVTLDTNLQYQQEIPGRKIAVLVLLAETNRLVDLSPLFPACAAALQSIRAGEIVEVGESAR